MTRASDWRPVVAVLRLAIDGPGAAEPDRDAGWRPALTAARAGGVLLRVVDALLAAGERLPDELEPAVRAERERAACVLRQVAAVSQACESAGIAYVLPKAFAHLPDVGSDIDLLVSSRPAEDARIVAGLRATAVRGDVRHRLEGSTVYRLDGCPAPLDVHHGRLGAVGEHAALSAMLLRDARRVVVGGVASMAPPPEQSLVVHALGSVYGRFALRLSDVVHAVALVRAGALDWHAVAGLAARAGVRAGVGCHLAYVDQVHRVAYGRPLLGDASAGRLLPLDGWGAVELRGGAFPVPVARAATRLHACRVAAAIGSNRWGVVCRLSLLPVLGVAAATRRRLRAGFLPSLTPRTTS